MPASREGQKQAQTRYPLLIRDAVAYKAMKGHWTEERPSRPLVIYLGNLTNSWAYDGA